MNLLKTTQKSTGFQLKKKYFVGGLGCFFLQNISFGINSAVQTNQEKTKSLLGAFFSTAALYVFCFCNALHAVKFCCCISYRLYLATNLKRRSSFLKEAAFTNVKNGLQTYKLCTKLCTYLHSFKIHFLKKLYHNQTVFLNNPLNTFDLLEILIAVFTNLKERKITVRHCLDI